MMTEFNKRDVQAKLLGERLKEIRERKGVSLEEMANAIKVNKKYLQKIEDDDYENMPSEVYIKGFLKSYSDFLGIKYGSVLAIYQREREIVKNIQKNQIKSESAGKIKKNRLRIPTIVISFRLVAGSLFVVFVIGVMGYFYREANKLSETPRLLISQPIDNSTVDSNSVELIGTTDIGSKVEINGQPVFVDENGGFKEKIGLKEGINNLTIKSKNKFGKEIVREITLSSKYKKDISPESDKGEVTERNQDVFKLAVRAKNSPVWIAVKVDGELVYTGTVLAEAEQVFQANDEVSITSGKASQTLIKVNDEEDFHELAKQDGVARDIVFRRDEQKNEQSGEQNNKQDGEQKDKREDN